MTPLRLVVLVVVDELAKDLARLFIDGEPLALELAIDRPLTLERDNLIEELDERLLFDCAIVGRWEREMDRQGRGRGMERWEGEGVERERVADDQRRRLEAVTLCGILSTTSVR